MTPAFSKKDFLATKWFTLEKGIQMITGIFIIPKIFNVLGTVDIGKFKFVESIIGMLSPIFFLGLTSICIREIIFKPKQSQFILFTALYLRLFSWLVTFLGILAYILFSEDRQFNTLVIIVAFSYLFKVTDIFEYYLIAKKWTKVIFITKITSLLIIVALQYYGVVNGLNVSYFAIVIASDFVIQGLLYFLILKHIKAIKIKKTNVSLRYARQLLSMSFPLILTNSLVMFYISIDEFFLNHYNGNHANGVFGSVQFLVITLTWNIGFAIINALYPSLAESFKTDKTIYVKKIKHLLFYVTSLGVFIGLFYSLFGDFILDRYFATGYAEAKTPLKIFCWSPLFIFLGMVYEKHIIITNRIKNNVYRFILGCFTNLVLCYYLIPPFQITGAAIAVLTSHFMTNIFYVFFDKQTRKSIPYLLKPSNKLIPSL